VRAAARSTGLGAQITRICAAILRGGAASPLRQIGGSARGYQDVGGPLNGPGMAHWMAACSVYLYIAILGANVRFCRYE
jgi:hypothetical protein